MNRIFATLAVVGALLAGARASTASDAGTMRVDDQAGAFTPEGISKATEAFRQTTFQAPTYLTIVTVGRVPQDRRAEFDAAASNPDQRAKFFDTWARELASTEAQKGVFVLVYLETTHDGKERFIVRTLASEQTDVYRSFTDADARRVSAILTTGLEQAKGKTADEAKTLRDTALEEATNFVADQLKNTTLPREKGQHAVAGGRRAGIGSGVMGWVCMGVCVLLGVWVVVGLIRAMSGGGGYGGYGGPGGGGFFSSLMGGMFGTMAGMWMYNNLFGSGMSDIGATEGFSGDPGDTGADSYDGGASGGSEGGDWGGGADTGGGDWGGGGDFGGGDW